MNAQPNREQPTGRYAPDPTRVCKCGHTLGNHIAEGRVAERECCEPGCCCRGFKRERNAQRVARLTNPACGHSACSQYYIDTGENVCVAEDDEEDA